MLGYDPIVEKMVVISGQDFAHTFQVEGSSFPPSTVVTLKIYARDNFQQLGAWPAVSVSSSAAVVQINSEDLEPIPDASTFRVYVQYPGGEDLCWYRGRVWRRN